MILLLLGIAFGIGFGCAAMPPYTAQSYYYEPYDWDQPYDTDEWQGGPSRRVVRERDCIGPVISGACHGAVLPPEPRPERCAGVLIGGVCTGTTL